MPSRIDGSSCRLPTWALFFAALLLPALSCGPRPAPRPTADPQRAPLPDRRRLPPDGDRAFLVPVEPARPPDGAPPAQDSALLPLACLRQGELRGGQACAGLIAPGQRVALGSGRGTTVGEALIFRCAGQTGRFVALRYAREAGETVDHGVWPPSTATRVSVIRPLPPYQPSPCRGWCSFERTGHPRVRLEPDRRQWLAAGVKRSAPELADRHARQLELVQEVRLDLDGDGEEDRLFSLVVPDRAAASYRFLFSAIYLAWGRRPQELVLIRRLDSDALVLRGTLDLDDDGRRELWLLHVPAAIGDYGHSVVALDAQHPAVLGSYLCRPADS